MNEIKKEKWVFQPIGKHILCEKVKLSSFEQSEESKQEKSVQNSIDKLLIKEFMAGDNKEEEEEYFRVLGFGSGVSFIQVYKGDILKVSHYNSIGIHNGVELFVVHETAVLGRLLKNTEI